ncbi:MAG: T9SS type A sorting domain-containing protein [Ignavibacteriales bacterium]|nr:MAG: T9SS type A sorting domain-containing protein [Ignavibacteriales bacterium]
MRMKVILGIILFSTITNAQWIQQNSGTTLNLNDVSFLTDQIGFVTGDFSSFLRTTNYGEDWLNLSFSAYSLSRVFRVNQNQLFIVGYNYNQGVTNIYKSTNNGIDWVNQLGIPFEWAYDMAYNGPEYGIVTGGLTVVTTNGGTNWQQILGMPLGTFYGVSYPLPDRIIIVGQNGSIYRSTDYGFTWQQRTSNTTAQLNDVSIISTGTGFAVGNQGTILKTINTGSTWSVLSSGVNTKLNGVHTIDSFNAFIVGDNGLILRTTNSGSNWVIQQSGINSTLNAVLFIDTLRGWIVGNSGIILSTNNSGLPVEILSFNAEATGKGNILFWITATETNNRGFDVEKRIVGSRQYLLGNDDWRSIGFVEGKGTTTEAQSYSYIDEKVIAGKYQYRLKQIDFDGSYEYSNVVEVEVNLITEFVLEQNYPNPFNPTTKIGFSIPTVTLRQAQSDTRVTLKVFDVLGNEVATLVDEYREAGKYEIEFDAGNLSSGVYYYQLKAGSFTQIRKMILIK